MALDHALSSQAQVTTPSGHEVVIPEGDRLVFGRGPGVDLMIPEGRGLSRRAGVINAVPGGAWVANLSRTHSLYTESGGHRVRLPRLEGADEPRGGWFLRAGTALVGSRAMLDEDRPLLVMVADAADTGWEPTGIRSDDEQTLLPVSLDPGTKVFLVALLWCRPWLIDPSRTTPLPRTPEIARAALAVTDAHYEIERFDADPQFRDRLSARVGEHLRVLRRKILERGLVRAGTRLSDEVVVGVLIENAIIGSADLVRLEDPGWRSRQEQLWWSPASD
ncbi:MAG: hypothetical protein QOE54_927 [Streptosporangiaceae bacterium]|nr:hypothetical protein [Streptosporangiaceae bacterium]MDX6428561.1 hypothetical protein [Streptosporangiaceae bacterium]